MAVREAISPMLVVLEYRRCFLPPGELSVDAECCRPLVLGTLLLDLTAGDFECEALLVCRACGVPSSFPSFSSSSTISVAGSRMDRKVPAGSTPALIDIDEFPRFVLGWSLHLRVDWLKM